MRLPAALGALEEREFRLLFTGQAISLLGDGMVGVALSFAVLDLTGSVSDLGFVFAARTIPLVVFLLVGGVFADRLPRRAVMLTADAVRFATQGVVAVLLLTGEAAIWQLVLTQAIYGTATAFFNPASTGLIPQTVSAGRLQQANALRGLAQSAGTIAGPALAGVLVAAASPGWAIAVDSVTFAVSAIFLSQLRLPPHQRLPARPFLHDLHEGWREVRSRTWVWTILVWAGVGNMASAIVFIVGPYVAKQSLGGAGSWALIVSMFGVGAVCGGILALHVRARRPLLYANLGIGLVALPPALLALELPAGIVAVGAFFAGAGVAAFNPFWETALQREIPPAALSRVSAYDWLMSMALNPVGALLVGPLVAGIGVDATLWVACAIFAGGTAVILAVPSVRNLTDPGAGSGLAHVVPEVPQHPRDRPGEA
jgi:MFS family permease